MSGNDLKRLIEQNEKLISQNEILVKQNNEIIALIKKEFSLEDETEIIDGEDFIFSCDLGVGEVLTVTSSLNNELDIYKINVSDSSQLNVNPGGIENSVKKYLKEFDDENFNVTVDNLTGYYSTTLFNVPFIIALESLDRNMPIHSGVCILDNSVQDNINNLSEILRISIENGADKIFLPLKSAMGVVHAPQQLLNHLVFYKKIDDIIDELF